MPQRQPLESKVFRDAMSLLASAVSIVTTDGKDGRHGFTASAVCSVSDNPATLLICVNRSASTHAHLLTNGLLAVNVLGHQHQSISNCFGDRRVKMTERFAAGEWRRGEIGMPILTDALVSLECRISQQQEIGTHTVIFAQALCAEFSLAPGEGLVWFNRSYRNT
ncbi:flavin reductase family protein [Kozakia baliensis]|uniref:flavin reductase family protein n=1 Tax=Kozakia baliensis TaxID=153496 RepID=UPI000496DECB|nr:flavin reductase family protein [Kozakia baliensis]